MTGWLLAPAMELALLPWITAAFAAVGGAALHLRFPPRDPAVTEALLIAAAHP